MGYEPDENDPGLEALLARRRTPRQRVVRAALVVGVVLALVVLLGGVPALRQQATSPVVASTPTTPRFFRANASVFYLDTNLPNMSVTLDGQPVPSDELEARHPFQLTPGRHQVSWQAGPFTAQSCTFSSPPSASDTCQRTYGTGSRHIFAQPSGDLLQIHVSLLTLTQERQQALIAALDATTNDLTAIIQPGEPYLTMASTATADKPLRATLRARLDLSVAKPHTFMSACVFSRDGGETSPCLAAVALGSCVILCILPFSDSVNDFLALAPLELQWDYSTLDGQSVAQRQMISAGGGATSVHYGLFHVIWDGANWHATLLSGPQLGAPISVTGLQIATDLACVAAMDEYFGGPGNVSGKGSKASEIRFHSSPNPADGCLITTTTQDTQGNAAQIEMLDRFGVLSAVGDATHRLEPSLPMAGVASLAAARQLATYPGQVVNTEPLGVVGD